MEQLPAVQHVDRYVHERRITDQIFIGWGVYFFVLTWATLGVYSLIMFYRRLNRADLFRDRRLHYYTAVIEATGQYADEEGHYEAVRDDLDDMGRFVKVRFQDEHRPIGAGMSLFLSIITLGVYGFYAVYRLMRFWWQIQLTEQDFDEKLSLVWSELGIARYPVVYEPVPALNRSFGLHLLLTVVTVGFYGIVWDYELHTDPEKVFPETHAVEDTVLNTLRHAAPAHHAVRL